MVLRTQGQIGAERLRHVLVKICGKGQCGVQIEHQTAIQQGIVYEEDVVVLKGNVMKYILNHSLSMHQILLILWYNSDSDYAMVHPLTHITT